MNFMFTRFVVSVEFARQVVLLTSLHQAVTLVLVVSHPGLLQKLVSYRVSWNQRNHVHAII